MADVLDIARIEKELQEINQQRSETRERLDAMRGGRGRGRGPPGGRGDGGVFSRLGVSAMNGGPGPRDPPAGRPSVFDRLYSQGSRSSAPERDSHRHGRDRDGDRHQAEDLDHPDSSRQLSKRLGSRISSEVVGPANGGREQHDADADVDRDRPDAPVGRKRLLSAVVVNGQARQLSGPLDDRVSAEPVPEERPQKRPTLAADDKTKRRAARMFGTLLVGTLQKFQNDEQAFKKTDTAQRRAEIERRAQERAESEAQRLREQAAASAREEREAKLNALHDLNLQAETKALELRCARRIQHRQQLVGLCITTTQPALYWRPRETSKESLPLLQEAGAAFESWKQQQLQELEAERAELVQAAAARREAALARPAARQHPATGDAAGDGAGDGAAGTGGNTCGDEGAGEDGAAILGDSQQQQYLGDEEQQQRQDDEDMQEAAGDDAEEQQEEEQPRVGRFRNRGSDDEDEERLLSSDDEDA